MHALGCGGLLGSADMLDSKPQQLWLAILDEQEPRLGPSGILSTVKEGLIRSQPSLGSY